jgi:hypothetical protein
MEACVLDSIPHGRPMPVVFVSIFVCSTLRVLWMLSVELVLMSGCSCSGNIWEPKKNYWIVLYMFGFWWWLDLFLCYCFWRCTVLLRRIRKTRDPPLFCGRQLRNHHQVKRPICVATAFYYNSNFDRHLQMDDLPWLCLQAQSID